MKSELERRRQRLVYNGRILDDGDRLLSDYGIFDQATLFLVVSSIGSGSGSGASSIVREERCAPGPNEFIVFFGFVTNLGATGSLSVSHYSDPAIRNPTWKDLRLQEEAKYSSGR
jgi:hypothetical protein